MDNALTAPDSVTRPRDRTRFTVLGAISFSHLLNDMLQSLIVSIYPLLKGAFTLSFVQIGIITLTYQVCASVLQPLIGSYTDRHPQSHALSAGMACTLTGLLTLAWAPTYLLVLLGAALIGTGSAIFHPESSRIARLASGGRHGLAQSIFQVGGSAGSALGPLIAAWIILPHGQASIAWFALAALVAIVVLWNVGGWYHRNHLAERSGRAQHSAGAAAPPAGALARPLSILLLLIFSKYFYLTSIGSYYIFFLISKFHLSVASAQVHLFVFLAAAALGTLLGGPIGDRVGRKQVIWASILGVAPFTLALPFADLTWTGILSFVIGLVLASAFSAIVLYGQELMPGRVGMVSGLFFGFAFGVGGIGAAVLGVVADHYGVESVFRICAFLPLLGVVAAFLPNSQLPRTTTSHAADAMR
jgi:FSR family fosmidomycin resistance protein-like MFS transporter